MRRDASSCTASCAPGIPEGPKTGRLVQVSGRAFRLLFGTDHKRVVARETASYIVARVSRRGVLLADAGSPHCAREDNQYVRGLMADLQINSTEGATPNGPGGAGALEGGKYVYCIIRSDRLREF